MRVWALPESIFMRRPPVPRPTLDHGSDFVRLYDRIIVIAQEFMGPAAEDYIGRRIRITQHGSPPQEIRPDRLERLAAGIEMTAKAYMSESKVVQFRDRILALSKD